MASVTFSTIDRQSKGTSMTIGADNGVSNADVQALADALDLILRGADVRAAVTIPNIVDPGSALPPQDKEAQRGNKWLFRVQVNAAPENGKILTHEIGTADNSTLATATDDFLDLTSPPGAALKAAFETVYRSSSGNTGILLSVQQVNRGQN